MSNPDSPVRDPWIALPAGPEVRSLLVARAIALCDAEVLIIGLDYELWLDEVAKAAGGHQRRTLEPTINRGVVDVEEQHLQVIGRAAMLPSGAGLTGLHPAMIIVSADPDDISQQTRMELLEIIRVVPLDAYGNHHHNIFLVPPRILSVEFDDPTAELVARIGAVDVMKLVVQGSERPIGLLSEEIDWANEPARSWNVTP